MHYGACATSEQVNAAGDLCAICQEKMHTPILLRCKHIFCKDCVSECYSEVIYINTSQEVFSALKLYFFKVATTIYIHQHM
ncbi:hypothetical protein GYH30_026332 [Glycine max]|nr:hypothetical protein GYH30_026332 [Glycine max]